ncbi:hypothetical protein [Burkholderia ubonensis]|uniref:hypothetical protein n=1 Tax=Burkholderia ubonensis TaxID=101571 RepID=UPI0012FBF1BA|nr:hypothetical protein [Burkholderia ubonensis]
MEKPLGKRMKERTEADRKVTVMQIPTDNRKGAAPVADSAADQAKCVGPIGFCNPHFDT